MKTTRIAVLVIALGAGGVAALLMSMMQNEPVPDKVVEVIKPIESEEVLVASGDISLGAKLGPEKLTWQPWPEGALVDQYIKRTDRPDAIRELTGAIARSPFMSGEPMNDGKLIRAGRGFMSAILPKGKRAIAVEVRAATTAGGFILPNDRVDVILTQATPKSQQSGAAYLSQTILENVRVLAIDQKLKEDSGEKTVVARDTATLELTPNQSERIVQAQQTGTISLALRSIADSEPGVADAEDGASRRRGVSMVKFGVSSQITTRR